MSNFSNLGFQVKNESQLRQVVEEIYPRSYEKKVAEGSYFQYHDESGAELWVQVNNSNEIIGVNPHFEGKGTQKMRITNRIRREDYELDGALHGWMTDSDGNEYFPFVFDLPDFHNSPDFSLPAVKDIQLTAFARELSFFADEERFHASQEDDFKWSARSFIPTGLFHAENAVSTAESHQATAVFSGEVLEMEKRTNAYSGISFYWFLLDTLGAAIDVVADQHYFPEEPQVGGILHGSFWLSGRIKEPESAGIQKKTFFDRFFG